MSHNREMSAYLELVQVVDERQGGDGEQEEHETRSEDDVDTLERALACEGGSEDVLSDIALVDSSGAGGGSGVVEGSRDHDVARNR